MLRLPSCPVLLVLALPLLAAPAHGQVRIGIDNDLFGLRGADAAPPDHEYTHGTSVSWDGRGGTRWELGQRIYTPRRDGAEPVPGERPYAGWLYGAWERAAGSERARSLLRLEAGVTGRPSLAEPVQNGLHRLAGYTPQLGWKHQLGFEPALAFSFAREHRVRVAGQGRRTLEVLPGWDASAGTLRTAPGRAFTRAWGSARGTRGRGAGRPRGGRGGWRPGGGRKPWRATCSWTATPSAGARRGW